MFDILNPFTDIDYLPPELKTSPTAYQSAKTLQIGYGSEVLRANRQGLWMGRNTFEEARDAPTFAVSMDGTLYIQQIQASGVIISGSTTLADWRHSSDLTTIAGGEIYTGSITASKITVASLSALSANLGTVTAGTYQTAGSTRRIKIEDDYIQWQYYKLGSWNDCGVLRGDDSISFRFWTGGSKYTNTGYGIEHYHSTGVALQSSALVCSYLDSSAQIIGEEIYGYSVGAINTSDQFVRFYKPITQSPIQVSYSSANQTASIYFSPTSNVDFNGYDAYDIDDCKAVKFWGNGSGGITGSHSWVNAEGDTVDIQVVGGIVTNFTVTP